MRIEVVLFLFFLPLFKSDYPFRNTSLSWDIRVDDLVNRLTLEEIMVQMSKGGSGPNASPAPGIPRLNIGPKSWNTECLRGDGTSGPATSFPQALGLAASFSRHVIKRVAQATSMEVRGKYNEYVKSGQYGDHKGISCFSPVINIMRHPLWGRNQETYGEDPFLTGSLAQSFVTGLQGENPRYVRANAGCKHFDVYGGPENIPVSRFSFDAVVSERDWRLTFLPAFKKCVEAGTYSIMCSFNKINGVPACGNKRLLTDILRKEWGFKGYVVSDQAAIENVIDYFHYRNNSIDTVALCVNAGCNLELSTNLKKPIYFSMLDAIKAGKLKKSVVLENVKPLFYTRMRLGEFDPPNMNPYSYIDTTLIQSNYHRRIALNAAMKSFVLLKNVDGFLPLKRRYNTIAVVGPMANNTEQLFGNYSPDIDRRFTTTPLDGLRMLATNTKYGAGCKANKCTDYRADDIKTAVTATDVIVVCLGTGQELESEDNDRQTMDLPANQTQLIKDVIQYSGNTPIVLLLFNAGPLNITWIHDDSKILAIMECFFPAQSAGEAIHRVLSGSGTNSNPAGRLPFTWPKYANQFLPITNYTMEGRTYRYFKGNPLYPFGYGLSYTSFRYRNAWLTPSIPAGFKQEVRVEVQNTGTTDGEEVIQIYLQWLDTKVKMPQLQLVAFERVFIKANDTLNYLLNIESIEMAVWDDHRGFLVEPGRIRLYIGGQQPHQQTKVDSNILIREFKIEGRSFLGGDK